MATNFPGSIDTFANPVGTDLLENANPALDHDVQHSNANDAIEALEAKVGANNSAVTTSHDYKLSSITGTNKALSSGSAGTQSITDLTLVNPKFTLGGDATGDTFYRDAGGDVERLPIGTNGQIFQVSPSGIPEWVSNPAATDATYTVKGVDTKRANAEYYAVDAEANDTYVITLSPAPNAYVEGQEFSFKANTANTGAATLNVNGLGAKTIVKGVNTTLADNDILADQIVTVRYDGTNFVLQSPVSTATSVVSSKLLRQSSTPITSSTADTNENNLFGYTIPGGTLSTGNVVKVKISGTFTNQNGTPTLTLRGKYNVTTVVTAALVSVNSADVYNFVWEFNIYATGSVATQTTKGQLNAWKQNSTFGGSGNQPVTINSAVNSTENSANNLDLTITAQLSSTSNAPVVTITDYIIERIS